MSSLFDPKVALEKLKLPPQDIDILAFCASNKAIKVREWTTQLRTTQVNQTSVLLYQALPEIVHLRTDAKTRFEMLESVRTVVQQSILGLAKEFLHQPLILPDAAQKTAIVAQALQKTMADGYTVCALQLVGQSKLKDVDQELLAQSLHRAITGLGLLILRSYQLYTQVPANIWVRLHTLFQVAEHLELTDTTVIDRVPGQFGANTVRDAYLRNLALACSRANQLSQNDIATVYHALAPLAHHIKILPAPTPHKDNLFLVNLNRDQGPCYKSRFEGSEHNRVLELDFQALVKLLSKHGSPGSEVVGSSTAQVPSELSSSLIEHLIHSWSSSVQRQQERRRALHTAEVSVGLTACHFQICGGQSFESFLRQSMAGVEGNGGVLTNLMPGSASAKPASPKAEEMSVFELTVQNISAGGYCCLWRGEMPARVEAGEVVAVREQGRRSWSIGIVRWIRQLKQGSQLGIQQLSNQPRPYAAAVVYDMGGYSDYMRALYLPNMTTGDQPAGLLTAKVPFQEFAPVKLKHEDKVINIRLEKCLFSTSKVQVFAFNTPPSKGDDATA